MASAAYARQLLLQASLDVETMVRNELSTIHSIAIDRAAIHGLGAAGEPTGIYKAIGTATNAMGGACTYAQLLAMQGKVAAANADMGALGYITHPTVGSNLKGVLDFPAVAAGRPVWNGPLGDGTISGYKAIATNQVSTVMATGSGERTGGAEIGMLFGNWNDLIIGSFGALELIVDPYRLKKQGIIEVTSFQMCDVLLRHGESFCKATGLTS
jgi:HK97 family phage major capsid protein